MKKKEQTKEKNNISIIPSKKENKVFFIIKEGFWITMNLSKEKFMQ